MGFAPSLLQMPGFRLFQTPETCSLQPEFDELNAKE